MSTTATPALTMETLHDTVQYRHLVFRQGLDGWELFTFPGGCLVRRGFDHVFAAPGSADIADVAARAGADPAYWAGHTTAGTTQSWDEERFRAWVEEQDQDLAEEVSDFLSLSLYELDTEAGARQALADAGLDLNLSDWEAQDCYTWDETFLIALRSMVRGLEHYRG